jgi:hypothetical protein
MDILKNLNHRLTFTEGEASYGGENEIKMVLSESPIQLPEDYIDFLRQISGGDSLGLSFQVDNSKKEIWIWSAGFALEKRDEFYNPFLDDFFQNAWLIGCDVGDLVYCYGKGKEGFGIYRTEDSSLCFDDMTDKIADTLTDFLVRGIGIDVSITL